MCVCVCKRLVVTCQKTVMVLVVSPNNYSRDGLVVAVVAVVAVVVVVVVAVM